jgi:hypothetical protein
MSEARQPRAWGAAVEAGCVFAAIVLYIWVLRQVWSPSWLLILAAVLVSHWLRKEGPEILGFRTSGLRRSFRAVLPALIAVLVILTAFGAFFHTVQTVGIFRAVLNLGLYLPWGLFQQYLLNGYFVNRLLLVFPASGTRWARFIAAALFGAAHTPNIFLMCVALVGGYVCVRIYLKYRNLYVLGILHGVVGFTLDLTLPGSLTHHFLVGPGYFTG